MCFRKAAVAILGAAAPMTVASWDTNCRGVALVRAYSDFVVRALGLHRANAGRPKHFVNVTYSARRASVQWPERAFCDTKRSYFDCGQLDHLQLRKLGRMVRNDGAVLSKLRSLEGKTDFRNGAAVKVRDVDFSTLSFEDQIAVDVTSDVLIGPHGAGLMHNIFMPDRATLIELHIDGSGANQHFHNLARWQGRTYQSKHVQNPLPVRDIVDTVIKAVEAIDINSY